MTVMALPEDIRTAISGSSFYAGMRILPKAEREAMFAVYGFCRLVDDIADGDRKWHGVAKVERAQALNTWRRDINALYTAGDAGQAAFLAEAAQRYGLDRRDFQAVIDGMQMDLDEDIRCPSFEKLDLYCDCVASAVGRLSVNVFGIERAVGVDLSHHLGRALQFTNILRDLDEDVGIGRLYLPIEALQAAGIDPAEPDVIVASPNLDQAARWLAAKARMHFEAAHTILAARPKGHLVAPKLMEAAYARILTQMEEQGWHAPRRRIATNKPRLVISALKFWMFG